MSKYVKAALLTFAVAALSNSAVKADEYASKTTQVETPYGSSSSRTTSTTQDNPTVVNQESTTTEAAPGVEKQVTTKKKYYVPNKSKTVVKQTETEVH